MRPGEPHLEGRARADLALDRDAAAVHLDDLLADGEPQAAPSGSAGAVFVHPIEPLEELAQLLLWDARACVPHAHSQERDVLLRSEEHTSELQSRQYLVCRLL